MMKKFILYCLLAIVSCEEFGLVHLMLENNREKCIVEDLPTNTVALVKHSGKLFDQRNGAPVENSNFKLMDPTNHVVTRQQSNPDGRVFLTAATTGQHLICFQNMAQYDPNIYSKLKLEVLLGDAGDPNIVAPVSAELNSFVNRVTKAHELVADVQREQTLQRDREAHFRSVSEKINKSCFRWPFIQAIVMIMTCAWQLNHLRRFFKSKKLV